MIKTGMHGKLSAKAQGIRPESLINTAAAAGVELWNVSRLDDYTISFEAWESSLDELQALAGKCNMELEIHRYSEPRRRVIKSRYVLLLLAALVCLVLLVSSLFIWQIDVHGISRLSRAQVLRALEDSGMGHGSFWPGMNADDLRSRVMLKLPDIGWMTVNISGSRAVVLINEREEKPLIYDEAKPADMVASKTGLIRRVSALNGRAFVQPAQAVTENELLISGTLESIMGTARNVRARGSVMADTWYEIDAVCPEQEQIKSNGGIARHRFALVLGKRRINFYISSGKAIDECDKIISEYPLGLDGHFALPVRLVHEVLLPYDSSPGAAYDKEEMGRGLLSMLESATEGQILQSSLNESFARGLYVLTLRAHCVENIAQIREYP